MQFCLLSSLLCVRTLVKSNGISILIPIPDRLLLLKSLSSFRQRQIRSIVSLSSTFKMASAKDTTLILQQLRSQMKNVELVKEPLSAYIIPSEDAHQSEYTADCDTRRAFVSGFDGSAGLALVTETQALLWTDGRYYAQALEQLDKNWTLMKDRLPETPSLGKWLESNLKEGAYVGVDPFLFSKEEYEKLEKQLRPKGIQMSAVNFNLVDTVWKNRTERPNGKVMFLPLKFSGKRTSEKLVTIRAEMDKVGASHLVVTALDEVAWLLNLRGSDIPFNPVFFAYLVVCPDGVELFIDPTKLSDEIKSTLQKEDKVTFHKYEDVVEQMKLISEKAKGKIWMGKKCNYALSSVIPQKKQHVAITPIELAKAVKNEVEVQGMINCHIRDAVALIEYFSWVEESLRNGETITEVSGAEKLHMFRAAQKNFINESFESISGSGPHGAIIHYKPTLEKCRQITAQELYLIDSGGQYLDGTTDTTRTLHFGNPTDYEKECFTRVLKGQIALFLAVFPAGSIGNKLDSLARQYLWEAGLDYNHGTGHGVGSFLNVHEGPIGITYRHLPDDPGFSPNMFVSNEPGYYEDGSFGIRLENVIRTVAANTKHNFNNKEFLRFEDVTLVPIQQKLIKKNMLTATEINYLNDYHTKCREVVGNYMKEIGASEGAYNWLIRETEPLKV